MPKSLADAKIKLYALTSKPTNPGALKVSDLTDAIRLDKRINKADYKLGATGNSSVNETEMCNIGEGTAPGPATYEGSITPFWYLDVDGNPIPGEMEVWDMVGEFGTELYLVEIDGPSADAPAAAKNMYTYYEAVTNTPQPPQDRNAGYTKRVVPLSVSNQKTGVLVTA